MLIGVHCTQILNNQFSHFVLLYFSFDPNFCFVFFKIHHTSLPRTQLEARLVKTAKITTS